MPGPRTVIIGLGVVGAALADELVRRGWTDVVVVDQGPLFVTGGSSSHAPGFVFQTSPSRSMCQLAQRTLDKLEDLQTGQGWVMKRVGGVELATTPQRLRELHRRHGFAESWGVPSQLIGPEEVGRLWPGLDTSQILGGLHTPTDAVVKGVRAVEFQALRAQAGGARLHPHTKVVGVRTDDAGSSAGSRVTGVDVLPVGAPEGSQPETVPAEVVVSCAGLWGPGLARELLGFELPMLPVEHGFGVSTPVGSRGGLDGETEVVRPMVRHQDFAMYFREQADRIAIGAYEHRPIPVEHHELASAEEFAATGVHPAVRPFTEDDYAPTWAEARRLVPELRSAQLDYARCFNGIFSFTPDGGPLLGPVPAVEGLWSAQAVWVTQSAGVGQVMADWLVAGEPGIDTHDLDLSRFDPAVVSRRWTREQGEESYDEVYDIVHPQATTLRLRGLRASPFAERQERLGAVFGSASGWERPLWYEANLSEAESGRPLFGEALLPPRDEWASRHWSPAVAAEARGLRERVGLVDMSSLPRLTVTGEQATDFLSVLSQEGLLSRPVGKAPGSVVYALLLSESGGVLSDITVARTGVTSYHLGTNGHLDAVRLRQLARRLGFSADGVRIDDAGSGSCGVGLWGPQARQVLGTLTDQDISHEGFRFYRCRELRVAGVPVLALRLSYVGELGWELYAPAEFGRFLWDALMEAGAPHGILPVGRRAFESLRLEKGFRLWGADMNRDHTPEEAGIGFAVRGPAAEKLKALEYAQEAQSGSGRPARRLCCLTLSEPVGPDGTARVLMGQEPVYAPWAEQGPVGYVTSADQGYTLRESIAYAWLPGDLTEPGTRVEAEHFGERWEAVVAREPLFDPTGERMRS